MQAPMTMVDGDEAMANIGKEKEGNQTCNQLQDRERI